MIQNFMKKAIALFLFSALLLSLPAGFKHFTCGFKLAKMRLEAPFRPDWEITPALTREEIRSILNQPYTYLDRGAQCYVFQSQDREYVIKLFRYDQPQNPLRRKKSRSSLNGKIEKLFSACLLAYRLAREETGLLHLHLNLTSDELPVLAARGPIGQTLKFPLDRYRFAIQKKASPFRESLLASLASRDNDALKRKIASFLSVLHSRIEKGVGNSDPTVSRNFGFFGEKAVEIDFGNYYPNPVDKANEIQQPTRRLRRWLKRHAPEWVSYFDEQVKRCENGLSS